MLERQTIDRDGWKWPRADKVTYPTVINELAEIPHLLELVPEKGVCIQAGGNGGLWVRPLAQAFRHVYTFEPDPLMFRCLVHNIDRDNVTFLNAAVGGGEARAPVVMDRYIPGNPGANRIAPANAGVIPTLRIDDLRVTRCDLIQLDIEGYEYQALTGAEQTITKYRPVICIELRMHSGHFGSSDEQIRELLRWHDYKCHKRMNFDEFWTPN